MNMYWCTLEHLVLDDLFLVKLLEFHLLTASFREEMVLGKVCISTGVLHIDTGGCLWQGAFAFNSCYVRSHFVAPNGYQTDA